MFVVTGMNGEVALLERVVVLAVNLFELTLLKNSALGLPRCFLPMLCMGQKLWFLGMSH